MSILNVDQISPIGSGSTITVTATETKTGDITIGTGTSISSPAGNTLVLGTNNVERLRISANGNVNIGTGTPQQQLSVTGSGTPPVYIGGANPGIKFEDTNASGTPISYIYASDGQLSLRADDGNETGSSHIEFKVDGSEKARIDSSGNLLVGTTTAAISAGKGLMMADAAGARIKLCDSDQGVTANDGFEIIAGNGGTGYIYNRENQSIVFGTNNTERMRITHEGSVGIGTDSSTYELEIHDGSGAAALRMKDGANNVISDLIADSTGGHLRTVYNHPFRFSTNQVERMRFTNDGRIRAGTQSAYSNERFLFYFSGTADNQDCFTIQNHNSYENTSLIIKHGRGGLSGYSGKMISFRGNDNSEEGSIVTGTTSTSFNTSSDYRLKENQVSISDGITRLKQLKPYRFNFKKDSSVTVDGFFAHEVSSIVPIAVTGDKDAMKKIYYEEGEQLPSGKKVGDFKEFSSTEISPQSMDHSKLVPLLTAALQEAVTKIEILEAKVAALESS